MLVTEPQRLLRVRHAEQSVAFAPRLRAALDDETLDEAAWIRRRG